MNAHRRFAWFLVVAALVGAALPAASLAAPKDGRGKGPAVRAIDVIAQAAAAVTDLTEDQKTKIHAIVEDATAQAAAMQADARAGRTKGEAKGDTDKGAKKEARSGVRDLVMQTQQNVVALLSDAQKPVFRQALADARAKQKEAREAAGEKKKAA